MSKFNKMGWVYLRKLHGGHPEIAYIQEVIENGFFLRRLRPGCGILPDSWYTVERDQQGKPNCGNATGNGEVLCYLLEDGAYEQLLATNVGNGNFTYTIDDHYKLIGHINEYNNRLKAVTMQ